MNDNLTIFGTDYTGVIGIKAKGTGNGTLTYVRPTGTKSITENGTGIDVASYASVDVAVPTGGGNDFVVTLSYNESTGMWEPDCTFEEAETALNSGKELRFSADYPAQIAWYGGYDELGHVINFVVEESYGTVYESGIYNKGYNWTPSGITIDTSSTYRSTRSATATPSDVANGKSFFNADGYQLGTASGPSLQSKTATPTTSQQTITPDSGYDGLSSVTVNPIPSQYIVPTGTKAITSAGTADVTNYASASVAAGSATASATKSAVSNHSIVITPSVTRTAGYIAAGSSDGTAITVNASELVSGSTTITENGTTNVTNLASVTVDIDYVEYHVSTSAPTSSQGSDGDIWLVTT